MHDLSPGRIVATKYRLERLLARGGMGSVWVARHVELGEPVAVKFMTADGASSAEARRRFAREASAAAQLQRQTQHVVSIYDYGVDGDTPYIVMPLLQGESLSTRLKRQRRLGLHELVDLATQLVRGLRKAHEAGIVHRDLTPGNVFFALTDDGEIVKVLDFGIAKMRTPGAIDETTRTGDLIGSPHYMSPEQARGMREIDHRSDLWSLGVVLYRGLTGELPFQGDQIGDVIVKICADAPVPPSELVPGLPPAMDRFFERALARSPAERFQTAREMAEAFAAIAGVPSTEPALPIVVTHLPSAELGRSSDAAGSHPSGVAGGTLTRASGALDARKRRNPSPLVLAMIVGGGLGAVAAIGAALVRGARARVETTPMTVPTLEPAEAPEASPSPAPAAPAADAVVAVDMQPPAAGGSSTSLENTDRPRPATTALDAPAAATRASPVARPATPASATAAPTSKPDAVFGF